MKSRHACAVVMARNFDQVTECEIRTSLEPPPRNPNSTFLLHVFGCVSLNNNKRAEHGLFTRHSLDQKKRNPWKPKLCHKGQTFLFPQRLFSECSHRRHVLPSVKICNMYELLYRSDTHTPFIDLLGGCYVVLELIYAS